MLDVQRRRLQHLMATAIVELWKKETGSLSSVVVEGTICITAVNGQTTVVQVDDRFMSKVGNHDQRSDANSATDLSHKISSLSSNSTGYNTDLSSSSSELHQSPEVPLQSRAEPQSSPTEPQRAQPETHRQSSALSDQVFYNNNNNKDSSNNNNDSDDSDIEIGCDEPESVKRDFPPPEELSSSGYGSTLGQSNNSTLDRSGFYKPGESSVITYKPSPDTAYMTPRNNASVYTRFTPLRRRSASPGLLMLDSMTTSTPKDDSKRPRLEHGLMLHRAQSEEAPSRIHTEDSSTHADARDEYRVRVKSEPGETHMWSRQRAALDLSAREELSVRDVREAELIGREVARDTELSLSDPQNYTAQVRHVIRQRLLANRSSPGEELIANRIAAAEELERNGKPSSVTPSASSTDVPYHSTSSRDQSDTSAPTPSDQWEEKVRPPPPPGPASWPHLPTNQDKLLPPVPLALDPKFFQFSPLLSIGHAPLPGLPPSLNPALFPGAFPAFHAHGRFPLPPGISAQDFANLSKAPLVSPGNLSSTMESNGDARSYTSTQPSERSTPDVTAATPASTATDINGNNEKSETSGDQKVYICEYCNKHFLFKSKYHEHLPVHTNARPYQCHLCSRTYKYKYDLQVHLRTHMGIPTKSTICPFCSGKFNTNKMLRNHIIEAHQDRQKVTKEECTTPGDHLPPAL